MSDRNSPERLVARFRTALDLHEAGVQMMRLKFRRLHPEESDVQVQARLVDWMQRRQDEIPSHRQVPWPRS